MIKLIIFDLDGTLVNAYPAVGHSVNHTLKALGFPSRTNDEIRRAVGWGDRELMAQFVGEDLADKAIRLYRPHHTKALGTPGGVRFLVGSKTLLGSLKQKGYKLAIASNRPHRFTILILKTLRLQGIFDWVLCADRAPRPKPHPDMLSMILKKAGLKKSEALFVGDMTIDVQTGKRAGVKTVAVTTGSSTLAQLKALKPYKIITRIDELKTILKGASNE